LSSRRRALSVLCWLVIAGLLVRIAVADTVEDVVAAPSAGGAIAVLTGLALIVVAAIVVVALGLGVGVTRARRLSLTAGAVAVGFGLALLIAGHQSASFVAALGALAAVTAVVPTAAEDASD
jgi:hypothetical protein